jgi:hypothetical protein
LNDHPPPSPHQKAAPNRGNETWDDRSSLSVL